MARKKRAGRSTEQLHQVPPEPSEQDTARWSSVDHRPPEEDAPGALAQAVPRVDEPPDERDPEKSSEAQAPKVSGSQTEALAAHLTVIVEAAERSAEELRRHTEQRARERIAEADRAAEQRVTAAEHEARELLDAAQREAERTTAETLGTVTAIHAEAAERQREAEAQLDEARAEAQRLIATAGEQSQRQAQEVRNRAREDARETVGAAQAAAREVLSDGTELSENLRELSGSLRNNAERLLRDIRLAHESMTSQLHAALPPGQDGRSSDSRPPDGGAGAPDFPPPR